MKVYAGGRSLDGAVVTVDGALLDPRYDIRRFSRMGFEWTYEGDGPRQLALALLADHLGDPQRALALTEAFMRDVVAELDNAWQLTSEEIDAASAGNLSRLRRERSMVRSTEGEGDRAGTYAEASSVPTRSPSPSPLTRLDLSRSRGRGF